MSRYKITGEIFPYSLQIVMNYRGCSKNKLIKNVDGLLFSDLKKFLKGYFAAIPEHKLRDIMEYFDWPYEFLYKDIQPVKSSLSFKN